MEVMAIGMAVYHPDKDGSMLHVFERADQRMYARKKYLKSLEV